MSESELTSQPFYGEFVTHRQPDAIRAAALANAVDLIAAIEFAELRSDDDVPGLALLWPRCSRAI